MRVFKPTLAILVLCILSLSAQAYITSIHAPAVLENENLGNLTIMQLNLTPGTGIVHVNGPSSVQSDTLDSAKTAASYAASYLGLSESDYNFNYSIEDMNVSVSGPSGGLALTLLAIAALEHRQLANNFTATGTISSDGTVGLISGVYDKSGAAERGGMRYLLVPYSSSSSFEHLIYYISQQTHGITLVEVANVSQALAYAFGSPRPSPLTVNLTQSYNIGAAGTSNITCSACNTSAFSQLANFTLGLGNNIVSGMSNNFSAAKQQLLSNTQAYERLAQNGYLYSAADLQFLDFVDAFTLANENNFTAGNASDLLSSISSYCSSLTPALLTSNNYEFVVGGMLRQYWANVTIANAQKLLSSEQSTDDIIESISTAAPAMGWCRAANELYSIAPSMGGNYVQLSSTLRTKAATAISAARNYQSSLYLQSALQAYSAGDYASALYSATYANTFSPSIPNMSTSQLYSSALQNIANATVGTWPSQFSAQSEFYLRQSEASQGADANGFATQAYTTSLLAYNLAQANLAINSSFITTNMSSAGLSQQAERQISGIEQSITQIYTILLFNALLLLVVLVVLLIHILPKKKRGLRG